MLRKRLFSIVFANFLIFNANAQIDTEFWFTAPDVISIAQGHADRPIYLRLASSSATKATISQPANSGFLPIVVDIPADGIGSVDLTAFIDFVENRPTNQVLSKGLLITSTQPISAYYEVLALGSPMNNQNFPLNPEVFGLKGKNALGTSFVLPGQRYYYNSFNTTEGFDIVATEDNTIITINPSIELTGNLQPNQNHVVTLNKGQTYSLRATTGNENFALRGTRISSNKPIAVTWSDDSIHRDGSIDLIGDQLLPNDKLGSEYVVVRGLDAPEQDHVFITAIENNTQISINGSVVSTLNAFATYDVRNLTTTSLYIKTSKPVSVLHLTGHQQGINPRAIESSASVLPPLGCSGVTSLNLFKNSKDDFSIFVIARKGLEGSFKINSNSNLLLASDFADVQGSNGVWVFARKSFANSVLAAEQNHRIENSLGSFHLGVLSSYKNTVSSNVGSSYAFFSNYADLSLNLGQDINSCDKNPVVLDAGPGRNSYLWSTGATSRTISVSQSGKYWVKITENGCEASDTLEVKIAAAKLDLGEDIEFCEGKTATLNAGSGRSSYLWSTGQTSSQIVVSQSGLYWVEVVQENCTLRDSINVKVNPKPKLQIVGLKDQYCPDEASFGLEGRPNGGIFSINGVANSFFEPGKLPAGIYSIRYSFTDLKGCSSDTTVSTEILRPDQSPCAKGELFIPELFSPNSDGANDVFQVRGTSILTFEILIFDRFGNQVYRAESFPQASTVGWDGGNMPSGVYSWQIRGSFTSGLPLSFNGKTSGVLRLVR
jgi:gliding motility-associated-like protein